MPPALGDKAEVIQLFKPVCGQGTCERAVRAVYGRIRVEHAELHMLDTGHFALEDHCDEIAVFVRSFYDRKVRGKKAA